MKKLRKFSMLLCLLLLDLMFASCNNDNNEETHALPNLIGDITFQINESSLIVSPQRIENTVDLAQLLSRTNGPKGAVRMQPEISFLITDATEVDSIRVYDYYMDWDTEILLFEKTWERSYDVKYIVPHSSTSANNPYGYNEWEERGFVFVITLATNVKYAYSFIVALDGGHL